MDNWKNENQKATMVHKVSIHDNLENVLSLFELWNNHNWKIDIAENLVTSIIVE